MELHSTMPSVVHNEQLSDIKGPSSSKSIKWDKEISFEEAYRALEAKFYSFKKVIGSKIFCEIWNVWYVAGVGQTLRKLCPGGVQTHWATVKVVVNDVICWVSRALHTAYCRRIYTKIRVISLIGFISVLNFQRIRDSTRKCFNKTMSLVWNF